VKTTIKRTIYGHTLNIIFNKILKNTVFWKLRRVALVRIDVAEEFIASIYSQRASVASYC
jgi:hypothetical protein